MFMFLKELLNVHRDWKSVVAALEMWRLFLICFAVTDMLRSPCCFSMLSLPCTSWASLPIWSLPCFGDSAVTPKDWQLLDKLVSTSAALTVFANVETSAEEHRERICVLSPLFLVPFPSVLHVCDPSCCVVIPSFGGHSCPLTRSCNPAKRLHFSPVVSEVFRECFKLRCRLKKYSLESLHGV